MMSLSNKISEVEVKLCYTCLFYIPWTKRAEVSFTETKKLNVKWLRFIAASSTQFQTYGALIEPIVVKYGIDLNTKWKSMVWFCCEHMSTLSFQSWKQYEAWKWKPLTCKNYFPDKIFSPIFYPFKVTNLCWRKENWLRTVLSWISL